MKHCHFVYPEDGDPILIPMCWSGIEDPPRCTCDVEGSTIERALKRMEELEGLLVRIREKADARYDRQQHCYRQNRQLKIRIAELEEQLKESRNG